MAVITSLLAICMLFQWCSSTWILNDRMPVQCSVRIGDVNIGAMYANNEATRDRDTYCTDHLRNDNALQTIEAIRYGVNMINSRDDILPNISLGYILLDECNKDMGALSRAIQFLPNVFLNENATNSPVYQSGDDIDCTENSHHAVFDVVAVLGPSSSGKSTMVAPLLSIFRMPVLSPFATSDELTDKARFEYFTRMAPPDSYQAKAIIDFLQHFNWTYYGLIYDEGKSLNHIILINVRKLRKGQKMALDTGMFV